MGGVCCLPKCKSRSECPKCKVWEICEENCKARPLCTKEDKGFFVEVRYLQLQDIDIPLQVNERKLLSLIRELEKEKEESIKNEMRVKKETEKQVVEIKNRAHEIVERAKAESNFIMEQAETNYSRIVEEVHNTGLKNMFSELGFTSNKHKSSLNYIRSLKDHEKVKYSIDFNTFVATGK